MFVESTRDRIETHSLVYWEVFLAHHELQVIDDDVVDIIHVDSVLHGVQNRPVNRNKCKRFWFLHIMNILQ